jgi:purine-nucleoside phosphorylase
MTAFEALFGIVPQSIQKTCIVVPLFTKGFLSVCGIKKLHAGKMYRVGGNRHFSVIQTQVGAGFVGDAVLYLRQTHCKQVLLFGSCGLVDSSARLKLGSLVTPVSCYAQESFSQMLLEKKAAAGKFSPDHDFLQDFLAYGRSKKIDLTPVVCSTVASLKLEEELQDEFTRERIEVVDMECSAFFAASNSIGLKSLALFYITDSIKEKPFYRPHSLHDSAEITAGLHTATHFLCDFLQKK